MVSASPAPDRRFVSVPAPRTLTPIDHATPSSTVVKRSGTYPAARGGAAYSPEIQLPAARPGVDGLGGRPISTDVRDRLRRDTLIVVFALGLAISLFSLLVWQQGTTANQQPSQSAPGGVGDGSLAPRTTRPTLVVTPQPPNRPAVAPTLVSSATDCPAVSPNSRQVVIQGAALKDGTVSTDVGAVRITGFDGTRFDLEAAPPARSILVQGGDTQYLYRYDPNRSSDHGLTGPPGPDGMPATINRIMVCLEPGGTAASSLPPPGGTAVLTPSPTRPAPSPPVPSTPPGTPTPRPATPTPTAEPTPVLVAANTPCNRIDPSWRSLTIDGAALGVGGYTNGERGVRITDYRGNSVSFESPAPFDGAIVAGPTFASVYRFTPPASRGAGLSAPSGLTITRVSFCYQVA